jgi:hypothetical protein
MVSTLGIEGTSTSNINENKNNPPTLQNPRPQKKKKKRSVKNQVQDLQRTEPSGITQVHVPPSSNPPNLQNSRPPINRHLVNSQFREFQRTEPWGIGQVHVPRSSNVPNELPFFTPQLPYQARYQSPLATYSSNFKHHSYVPGNVPPPFSLNPVVSPGSYNPPGQSHHGFVQTFHQNAVASNPYHGSFPHSSVHGRDYASLHARDYASLHARDYALYHHRRG